MSVVFAPSRTPSAQELAQPGAARAWATAKDFEAVVLGQFLAPMFDTVDTAHGMFGGGAGEETFRPMLTQEIAKQLAQSGGIGLATPIFRQILAMQEGARQP